MKITRKIDNSTAQYSLIELSHADIMKIYEGLSHFYSYVCHRHISEVEEDLAQKICKIIKMEEIEI